MLKFNGFSSGVAVGVGLGIAGGVAVGSVLGFVTGILLAPKSGAELRGDLVAGSENLYTKATASIDDMKSKTNEAISKAKATGQDLVKLASQNMPHVSA